MGPYCGHDGRWLNKGFTLFGGPIDWHLIKQKLVTKLSMEVELLALSHVATELIW